MRSNVIISAILGVFCAMPAIASDMEHMDHGSQLFHAFKLETDVGYGRKDTIGTWDFRGWVGGDTDKLWLRAEGSVADGKTEQNELWVLYSRNIATFWDAQAGVRYDTDPRHTAYLVAGINGLAPYYFETEAHVFLSNDGNVSARIRGENDFLLTQQLITQPYLEVNLFAQPTPELDRGSGLGTAEMGLQTRYEITRKFAPYFDVRYERDFGGTSALAKKTGDLNSDFIVSAGLRVMF